MRTTEQIEADRAEVRAWYESVRTELAPVAAAYEARTARPCAAEVEDLGVGPLLRAYAPGYDVARPDGARHYVYAFACSPIVNRSVADVDGWTVGVDYSDGDALTVDLPLDTDPALIAQAFLGMAHIATATYSRHYAAPRSRA